MVYMHHSFLSHLSADGHLGCFHVLAMINSAEMNIEVARVSFRSGFLGVYAQKWEPVTLKINPEYSLEGLMLRLNSNILGHLMRRADSLEKTLILGKIESKRRRG